LEIARGADPVSLARKLFRKCSIHDIHCDQDTPRRGTAGDNNSNNSDAFIFNNFFYYYYSVENKIHINNNIVYAYIILYTPCVRVSCYYNGPVIMLAGYIILYYYMPTDGYSTSIGTHTHTYTRGTMTTTTTKRCDRFSRRDGGDVVLLRDTSPAFVYTHLKRTEEESEGKKEK